MDEHQMNPLEGLDYLNEYLTKQKDPNQDAKVILSSKNTMHQIRAVDIMNLN